MRHYFLKAQKFYLIFSFTFGILFTIALYKFADNHLINSIEEHQTKKLSSIKSYDLVILILSSPGNSDRRKVIRDTWLKLKSKKVKHYFAIGVSELTTDAILHLSYEQSVNNDLVFLNHNDSYSNLCEKLLKSFKWLTEQSSTVSTDRFNFKYLLKCDDDSFVRVDLITNELESISLEFNEHFYWGYFKGNAQIKLKGKWKEPNWNLCDRYLPYALGGGYILSESLVKYISNNGNYLRCFNSEDTSVGLWLSAVKNIEKRHDRRFDTEWESRGCQNNYLITHKHSTEKFLEFFNNIKTTNQLCENEVILHPSYSYSWNVPPSKCCKLTNIKLMP